MPKSSYVSDRASGRGARRAGRPFGRGARGSGDLDRGSVARPKARPGTLRAGWMSSVIDVGPGVGMGMSFGSKWQRPFGATLVDMLPRKASRPRPSSTVHVSDLRTGTDVATMAAPALEAPGVERLSMLW